MKFEKSYSAPRNEQETVVSYDREKDEWNIWTDVPKHVRKYLPLVVNADIRYNDKGEPTYLEGVLEATISISKRRKFTEVQKKALAKRLQERKR